jgi:hypothetical protein
MLGEHIASEGLDLRRIGGKAILHTHWNQLLKRAYGQA